MDSDVSRLAVRDPGIEAGPAVKENDSDVGGFAGQVLGLETAFGW